ncbi:flagellin N-terminal helical domain-containing protein [Shewanella goraebulensis]|uniref:flagellin N-terminal helical domain-containing protein n=1 Tax=Shewanella goraebulensis TaxID=3050637 RepID=UPI00254E7DC6|nr:flagellin [Shewanella goraebulensis]
MLSVHTNIASNIAQSSVAKSNDLMTNAMERLSTGLRINSAADDAAGLQIATRLNANVTGMEQASRNVNDATSMLQTADGALEEITTIAMRQQELATQAANGVNSTEDLEALENEYNALNEEITRIVEKTEFAGNKLFSAESVADAGDGGVLVEGVSFQIGAGSDETLEVAINGGYTVTDVDWSSFDGEDAGDDPTETIDAVKALTQEVGEDRSELGANINRLSHTASNLTNVTENTKAAAGRIMDADFAVESANMTKNQLLVQAGTTVLSNANQNTGLVMNLLR